MEEKSLEHLVEDENKEKDEKDEEQGFSEDYVIDDLKCPKCGNKITDDTEFCSCGFYVKASKNSSFIYFMILIPVIFAVIAVIIIFSNVFPETINRFFIHIDSKSKLNASTSPVIQTEVMINKSDFSPYILKVYAENIKKPNVLVILVKPEIWMKLKPETKENILFNVKEYWKSSYKGDNPVVRFANAS